MKHLRILFAMTTMMLSVFSYGQQKHPSTKDLLKTKAMQDSVMSAICHDPSMMENMMNHMMQSKHAMQQMMQNKEMMQKMNMMASTDSSQCQKMMAMMMKDKDMRPMMMNMMMKNKMSMGDMGMDNESKQDSASGMDHSSHH